MNKMTLAKVLIPSLFLAMPSVNAGLLTNESFETPVLTSTTQDLWDQNGQVGASGVLTGWGLGEFNYFSLAELNPRTQLVNNSGTAYSGSQFVAFNVGEWGAGGTVFQSFSAAAGTTYSLSYAVGWSGGAGDTVTLQARAYDGSTPLGTTQTSRSSSGWEVATLNFTTSSAGSIMIEFMDITPSAGGNNADLLLDGVSLTAVPEPSAYAAMFGVGLVGVASVRRFRMSRGAGRS